MRASIQPSKVLCIPEKAPRILPVRRSMSALVGQKQTWSEISFSLKNLRVRAFDSRAKGFSTPLARRRSSCPPPSPNLVHTHLIERYQALRDSDFRLSRATTSRRAPNRSAEEARTWEQHPQPIIPPPSLNRSAELPRQPARDGFVSRCAVKLTRGTFSATG